MGSARVVAIWSYLKQVSPQDNEQFLATLEAVLKAALVVWLLTDPSGVDGELFNSIRRDVEEIVSSVIGQLNDPE
ncbi:MAG: hypothetical protein ACRC0L_01650 [Angustibacter sp.]